MTKERIAQLRELLSRGYTFIVLRDIEMVEFLDAYERLQTLDPINPPPGDPKASK